MTKTIVKVACIALLMSGVACKKDKKDKSDKGEKAGKTTERVDKTPPAEEKPKLDTAEERVAFYRACHEHFSAKDWDKFGMCFTDDATGDQVDSGMPALTGRAAIVDNAKAFSAAFSDLTSTPTHVFASGNKVAAISTVTGTHAGPLKGPMGEIPATNKKVGYQMLHMVEFDPAAGGAAKEWLFADMGTMMGQLGLSPAPHRAAVDKPTGDPTIVIAKDDATEKANVEAYKKSVEAFAKRDMKALKAMATDDAKMHDMPAPADRDKKSADAFMVEIFKAFPDAKGEIIDVWAAGDYVVAVAKNTGTSKGPLPSMGLKKATGKTMSFTGADVILMKDGKATESWMFYNGMAIAQQLGLMPDAAAPPAGGKPAEGGDKPAEKKMAPEGEKAPE